MRVPFLLVAMLIGPAITAASQSVDFQILTATAAAPAEMRDGASVLGYGPDGMLQILRDGTNELRCLADTPGDDRFHVACYHKVLEPFMSRGRALRAAGMSRQEIQEQRESEIRSGSLEFPDGPAALYSLTAAIDDVDLETGEMTSATPLYVVYVPYATAESTGLSTQSAPGVPWLMAPGKPWAHIMLVPRVD